MKPKLIVRTLMLVLALAGGALGQDRSAPPVPKLVIAQTEFSFGDVKAGEVLNHTFVIKNEGGADLIIKGVAPS